MKIHEGLVLKIKRQEKCVMKSSKDSYSIRWNVQKTVILYEERW